MTIALTQPVDFAADVKPILTVHCLPCHHSGTLLSEFNLETRAKAFRATSQGLPLVPGYPEASLLWQLITSPHPIKGSEDQMPSNGPRLTMEEKAIIHRWIEEGAVWPDNASGHLHPIREPNEA